MAQVDTKWQDSLKRNKQQSSYTTVSSSAITVTLPTPSSTGLAWLVERVSYATDLKGQLTFVCGNSTQDSWYVQGNTTQTVTMPTIPGTQDNRGNFCEPGVMGQVGQAMTITLPCTTNGSLTVVATEVPQPTFNETSGN